MQYATNPVVEETLSRLIERLEAAFPGRIRAYYLQGSHADGSAVDTSDVDITVIFKERFLSDTEQQNARSQIENLPTQVNLDVSIEEETALFIHTDPSLRLASQLLYGEDIRGALPLMSIEAWASDRMHTSYWRLVKLFDRTPPLQMPLTYPDPHDEFYGYVRRFARSESGDEIMSTRDLMRTVGWMATALIAMQARCYVPRKSDLYKIYQEEIGDQWGVLIEEIYRCCKVEWRYRIPESRQALSAMCSRVLAFENHFLALYRSFLLQELAKNDEQVLRHLLWLLDQSPWHDDEILLAVEAAQRKITSLDKPS